MIESISTADMISEENPIYDKADEKSPRAYSDKINVRPFSMQELEEGRYLVQSEVGLTDLNHGSRIEGRIWEPLLGNELNVLWDEVLTEPGDAVLIKGSTVSRMFSGGYVVTEEGAPKELRTDIDIVSSSDFVTARLRDSEYKKDETGVSTKLDVHGLEVNVIDAAEMLRLNIEALEELQAILVSHNSNLHELEPEKAQAIVDSVRTLHSVGSTLVYEGTDVTKLLEVDSFFPWQTLGVALRRGEDGKLSAYLADPRRYFENIDVRSATKASREEGYPFGLGFPEINTGGIHWATMKALTNLEEAPTIESRNLVYTIGNIPIWLVATCEMRMAAHSHEYELITVSRKEFEMLPEILKELVAEDDPNSDMVTIFGPPRYENWVPVFKEVAMRLARGPELFNDEVEHYSSSEGGTVKVTERFRTELQESFARAAASHPSMAVNNALMDMPLGDLISKDIGDYFIDYHLEGGPGPNLRTSDTMDRIYALSLDDPNWRQTLAEGTNGRYDPDRFPQIETSIKFSFLANTVFPERRIPLKSLQTGETTGNYTEHTSPENMSEIMAMMLVSMGKKVEESDEVISRLIENWQPSGQLNMSWKAIESKFEKGLNAHKIKGKMKEYQKILDDTAFLRDERIP